MKQWLSIIVKKEIKDYFNIDQKKYIMEAIKTITKQLLLFTHLSRISIKILKKIPYSLKISLLQKVILILEKLEDEEVLASRGYVFYATKSIDFVPAEQIKVAYVLNHTLPFSNDGYAIRSHYISKAIQAESIDMLVVTRVGFPWDLSEKIEAVGIKEIYDGIPCFRLDKMGFRLPDVVISQYVDNYIEMLIKFFQNEKISIAHGASTYLTGLATAGAARALKIPSIYEVRGFWEITGASREPWFKLSVTFKMMKRLETQACNEATNVIALTEIVQEELVARGVDEKKIYIVPNGVNTKALRPLSKDISIVQNLKFENKFVIGFIGSVTDYEGLELLIKAAAKLELSHQDVFRYLIVGDGNDLQNLKTKVHKISLDHLFVFTDRVPHDEVEKYYSVMDTVCYPRLEWEVCRIVSPKKPFEAMAYGIPVISSSVRANSYFIQHGFNGLIHQSENSDDLMAKILSVYSNPLLRQTLSKGGREWVVKHRDSALTGKLLKKIYQETREKFYR
jgi:glycosyltransferase involved in cell wall biosynthesis